MSQRLGNIGPYELLGELGRGAMARVWRAWDPNLEREVAIKEPLFDPNLPEGVLEEMGRRFVAEGRVAASLSHPNIVTVYAANVWNDIPAIVMELVEGSTLSDLLKLGALQPTSALNVLDQLLDALGYAHAHGVVHRDIKPDNIFVTEDGTVKLADFGIAHVDGGASHATVAGTVLGTPGYMSPEQARGTEVDARSDLFSVGVIAHEMLMGQNPFGAGIGTDSTTLIYRIVHEPAPELPSSVSAGLPADLRPAIMAALCKDPAGRPSTAADFKAMLHGQQVPSAYEPTYQTVTTGPAFDTTARLPHDMAFVTRDAFETASASRAAYPEAQQVATGQTGRSGLPSWLPYAVVAGLCVLGLVIALVSAMGGRGGGGGGGYSTYLSVSDGYVAIYTSNSADPYKVTSVAISDLSPEEAAALGGHIQVASIEEAEARVQQYQQSIEDADAQAEAEAANQTALEYEQQEIEEARRKAEEEARKAEEEARKKAEEAKQASTATLTVVGADGTTRTETIRLDGTSQRVFADSNSRLLTEGEVNALSNAERCVAWNEIIAASNGYMFKNSGLASYFGNCSWYHPDPNADGSGNISGNAAENVRLLKSKTDDWWLHLATN